ncbi:MAG: hypothetical protein Kow0020_12010 [Wenzhouxiangellaceae bacterium]
MRADRGLSARGTCEDGEGEILCIGVGDPVQRHLEGRSAKKGFWTRAVFFVTRQQGALNEAHAQYLDARLVELAHAARRMPTDKQDPAYSIHFKYGPSAKPSTDR